MCQGSWEPISLKSLISRMYSTCDSDRQRTLPHRHIARPEDRIGIIRGVILLNLLLH